MVTFQAPQTDDFEDGSRPWKPKAGSPQSVVGTVVDRKTVTRQDGTDVDFVKVQTDAGDLWMIWCGSTQLRKCLKQDDPQAGDTWGVEFKGTKPIGNGRTMDEYWSFHRPASASPAPAKKAKKPYDIASGADMKDTQPADDEPF